MKTYTLIMTLVSCCLLVGSVSAQNTMSAIRSSGTLPEKEDITAVAATDASKAIEETVGALDHGSDTDAAARKPQPTLPTLWNATDRQLLRPSETQMFRLLHTTQPRTPRRLAPSSALRSTFEVSFFRAANREGFPACFGK